MKKLSYIIILISILFACTKNEPEPTASISVTNGTELSFAGNDTAGKEVVFETNYDWTATPSVSWCKLSRTSGSKGTGSFSVTVDKNETDEQRSASITIKANEATANVNIIQGKMYVMDFTESDYVLPCTGDTIKVTLATNTDYEYSIQEGISWIKPITKTKATQTFTHYFYVEPNNEYESRQTIIKFINKDNRETKTITVSQLQLNAIIPADSVYRIEAKKQNFEFEVSSNVEYQISVSENWIKYTQTQTKALLNKNIAFEIEENNSFEERIAIVTLKSDDVTQNVKIVQRPWAHRINVAVVHCEDEFVSPYFNGRDMTGTVDWGNGKREEYKKDIAHKYGNNSEKTTQYDLHGTKIFSFEISAINSIKAIKIVYKDEEE